jgi:hypothetical protein
MRWPTRRSLTGSSPICGAARDGAQKAPPTIKRHHPLRKRLDLRTLDRRVPRHPSCSPSKRSLNGGL